MDKETMNKLERIAKLNECIYNECDECTYIQDYHYNLFRTVTHIAKNVIINAQRIARKDKPLIITLDGYLTLDNSEKLLYEIYKTICEADFIASRRMKIRKIIRNFSIVNVSQLIA